MKINTNFWLKISFFNLLVVALLGVIMRYKIAFSFPFLDQKHLQHAHSHFAFIGWVAQTIFVLMVDKLQKNTLPANLPKYKQLLSLNLFASYGMLISFMVQGYSAVSIGFSTLSVLVSYALAYFIYGDLKKLPNAVFKPWFTAALLFNVLSSLGTFSLAFMMASKNFNTSLHLGALYFYLHFQYNGFFTFACFGLLSAGVKSVLPTLKHQRLIFLMLFYAAFPAFLLSVLWADLPLILLVVVVIAAFAQLVAWLMILLQVRAAFKSDSSFFKIWRPILYIIAIAVTAKYLLQLGSTIPALSKLAFGFRPIVVAYLHLILLAIVSVFLVTYVFAQQLIEKSRSAVLAVYAFVVGVYCNEVVLGAQGLAALEYFQVPFVNEILFVIAVVIVLALAWLLLAGLQNKRGERLQ